MVLSDELVQHMSLSTSSLSGLGIGFVHIFPLSYPLHLPLLLLFSMIVLFSVVQRVAWYERSRPDCFFSIVFNLGVFFFVLFSFSLHFFRALELQEMHYY